MDSLARHYVMVGLHKGMYLLLNKYQSSAQVHAPDDTSWELALSWALGTDPCVPALPAACKLWGCTAKAGTKYHCRNWIGFCRWRRSRCPQIIPSPTICCWHAFPPAVEQADVAWAVPALFGLERTEQAEASIRYGPHKAKKWHQYCVLLAATVVDAGPSFICHAYSFEKQQCVIMSLEVGDYKRENRNNNNNNN